MWRSRNVAETDSRKQRFLGTDDGCHS